MACVAWSRDGRLASCTSLGRDLVDWICPVLEKVAAANARQRIIPLPGLMCLADRRPRADALEADALVKVRNG